MGEGRGAELLGIKVWGRFFGMNNRHTFEHKWANFWTTVWLGPQWVLKLDRGRVEQEQEQMNGLFW